MSFLAFLAAALLLAVTPGPGIAYVVACTVARGRGEGLASCLGTALGGLVHVAMAALGLSLLVAQSALAFNLLKLTGVAYLVYLGLRLLLRRTDGPPSDVLEMPVARARGVRRAFLEGIVVEALNVKTALFFLAFLPQFVEPAQPLVPQLVLMGAICVLLNTVVDVLAVLAAARVLASGAVHAERARWLTRTSGATMLALAGWLALARRPA